MSHAITEVDLRNTAELQPCFAVFQVLRPHLDEATFIQRVREQAAQGYRIVCVRDGGEVVAAAGFRVANFLAWGRVLYVDDLITHPDKKRAGLGGALLDWLLAEGKRLDCAQLHLDSGHQRHDAHRLYLNKRLHLSSHHFSRTL